MNKIGICGYFGVGSAFQGGQPIRTKTIIKELVNIYGEDEVITLSTYKCKSNFFKFTVNCLILIKNSKNVILITTYNGIKFLSIIFNILNIMFKRKIHFIVIGSYLVNEVENNKMLRKRLKKIDCIYVQSKTMVTRLNEIGLTSVRYFPNFKHIRIIEKININQNIGKFKLCTFSRINKYKGIKEAVEAVIYINEKYNNVICTLDIYGIPDKEYEKEFKGLVYNLPKYIKYKGLVKSEKSVNVLKDYFLVLFPTYYQGEGFAGTILDSLCAGVPILASDWNYNSEFVDDYKTGVLFRTRDTSDLIEKLKWCIENPNIINDMKKNCISMAKEYKPEIVIKKLTDNLS